MFSLIIGLINGYIAYDLFKNPDLNRLGRQCAWLNLIFSAANIALFLV